MQSSARLGVVCGAVLAVCMGACSGSNPLAPATKNSGDEAVLHPTFNQHVRPLLAKHCWSCHNEQHCYGAPNRLFTFADTQVMASDSVTPVYKAMLTRVTAVNNAMPPSYPLSTNAQATLRRWVDDGTPEGPDQDAPATPTACESAPPAPAEAPFLEMRAHAQDGPDDAPYDIPDTWDGDRYTCFVFTVPGNDTVHVTRVGPVVDQASAVHHIALWKEQIAGLVPNEPFDCAEGGAHRPETWAFLYAWAPGANGLDFPEDVGLPLKGGARLIVQMHYHKGSAGPVQDRSGIRINATTHLRPYNAGMTAIGPSNFRLKPDSSVADDTCRFPPHMGAVILPVGPVRIFASFPHMHARGVSMFAEHLRFGQVLQRFGAVDRWSSYAQPTFPEDVLVLPGDGIHVRCTYSVEDGKEVTYGPGSDDEMCFEFLYTTPPISALGMDVPFCPVP